MKRKSSSRRKAVKFGQESERRVARQLEKAGFNVKPSPRSRTACDIIATSPGRKWCVQVKSCQSCELDEVPTPKREKTRLKVKSTRMGATPVFALVTKYAIKFWSAKSESELKL
jgi:Holliday junction resolvase